MSEVQIVYRNQLSSVSDSKLNEFKTDTIRLLGFSDERLEEIDVSRSYLTGRINSISTEINRRNSK